MGIVSGQVGRVLLVGRPTIGPNITLSDPRPPGGSSSAGRSSPPLDYNP